MAGTILRKSLTVAFRVSVGGYFKLAITTESVKVIRPAGNKVNTLGDVYADDDLLKQRLETGVRRGLQDGRDDQEVQEVKPGDSLHVSLYCKTDERFLEVLKDYESEIMRERLENELSQIKEISICGLKVEITNMDEVQETAELIKMSKVMTEGERTTTVTSSEAAQTEPAIIVQGGAFSCTTGINTKEVVAGTKESARAGYAKLTAPNGTAVDAVEEAIRVLEDNPHFNAGYGSYLNNDNEVECEAMIMDGYTMNTGAVISLRQIANPVRLSREIMDNTEHCALAGEGALKYARSINFPILEDPNALIHETTSYSWPEGYEGYAKYVEHHYEGKPQQERGPLTVDTITAVAIDENGHLACATSTGGIPGKLKGRVGDAPLVGCGGYANEFGAATTTGHGENIMKMTLAREVVFNMEREHGAQGSSEKAIQRMEDRVLGIGGVIAIDKAGNFGKAHNTKMMFWASIKDGELQYGNSKDDVHTEDR